MLKHEEMIENVHRRIAQYEEEKRMKRSKFKNIISVINTKTKNDSVKTNEDEYTEVVRGTEVLKPSNRIIRTVSSVTAAALLVTGVGATGLMLHNNNPNKSSLSEGEIVCTEATDCNDRVSPFVDFSQIYFDFYSPDTCDNKYSDAVYDRIAVFLNNFDWGEGSEIAESDIPDFNNYKGQRYVIEWRKGDVWFYVHVTDEGKAYYKAEKCTISENGSYYYPVIESSVFDIDYETFSTGAMNCWNDTSDTEEIESIPSREKKYLTMGEFLNGTVENCDSKELIPEGSDSYNTLQDFLKNDFVDMLLKNASADYDNNDTIEDDSNDTFYVVCYYKTSDTATRRLTYCISGDGSVSICEYEQLENDSIPTGIRNYRIDIKKFKSAINEILNSTYKNCDFSEEDTSSEDFNHISFELCMPDNYDFVEYEDITHNKLAVFLNNFNWGERKEIAESDIPDLNNYAGKRYALEWQKDDLWFFIYVTDRGKAYHIVEKYESEGNYPVIKSEVSDIDYEVFNENMQYILTCNDYNMTDMEEDFDPERDKKFLTVGEFQNGIVERFEDTEPKNPDYEKSYDVTWNERYPENKSTELIPESNDSYNALQDFLKNDFVGMLERKQSVNNYGNLAYAVVCYYKTSDSTTRRLTYYIHTNGSVELDEYNYNDTITSRRSYYIHIKEFESALSAIFNSNYFEENTETKPVTTINISPQEQQAEKDMFKKFYFNTDVEDNWNSYDGTYGIYKDIVECMFHDAATLPFDKVFGSIADEEDAIAKCKTILSNISSSYYGDADSYEYKIKYYENYDIWFIRPNHNAPGTYPIFYIRGCDGKLLAQWFS